MLFDIGLWVAYAKGSAKTVRESRLVRLLVGPFKR